MPKIEARQCRFTGEIFTSERKFATHLRKLRKEYRGKREQVRFRRDRDDFFAGMRATCASPQDIEQFIIDNWPHFMRNAWANCWHRSDKPPTRLPKLISIGISFTWSDSVSCSHRAPLTNRWKGLTNWGGDSKDPAGMGVLLPRGYPGWRGTIKWEIDKKTDRGHGGQSGSEMLEHTGLQTGSGSGGTRHHYQLEMFADDWPALYNAHIRELVKKVIGFKDEYDPAIAETL